MKWLFTDDAGMGVLVDHKGRPDLTEQVKKLQTAWTRALIAMYGQERATAMYTEYAAWRQRSVTEPVGAWDRLVLNTKPVGWDRDIHGFLCIVCGETFAAVVIDRWDQACNRCARKNSTAEAARPQWRAYSHKQFVFPGLHADENKGEAVLVTTYADGETREYVVGEAGLLVEGITALPGFLQVSAQPHGDSRDTINLTIEAYTERQRHSGYITADFRYDPDPEGYEPHAYGFRLVSARLALGQPDRDDSAVTEHTDAHQLLGALLPHLYGHQQ